MSKMADKAAEQTFPIAQLIADAYDLLGYEPYQAAGGLYGQEDELSISQAKSLISEWLSTPLKEG
jgi:hypothetical protein